METVEIMDSAVSFFNVSGIMRKDKPDGLGRSDAGKLRYRTGI